tara:strand:+ start:385 stop:645 length:261 start_codon:yes stop_codon:yes gene_type:complete
MNNFQIFISGINNKTITFEINLSNNLSDIYKIINNKYGLNNKLYYLTYSAKIIDPEDITIYKYNLNVHKNKSIKKHSTIYFNIRSH